MKRFDLKTQNRTYKDCSFLIGRYLVDGSLAIMIYNNTDGPITRLTVCIPDSELDEDEVALDTNNCPWAIDFIKSHNFGYPTGRTLQSGYCTYPVVYLDIEELRSYAQWEGGAER